MKVVLESGQSDEKFLTDLRSAFPDVTFLPLISCSLQPLIIQAP